VKAFRFNPFELPGSLSHVGTVLPLPKTAAAIAASVAVAFVLVVVVAFFRDLSNAGWSDVVPAVVMMAVSLCNIKRRWIL
jgi:hypothetical protein